MCQVSMSLTYTHRRQSLMEVDRHDDGLAQRVSLDGTRPLAPKPLPVSAVTLSDWPRGLSLGFEINETHMWKGATGRDLLASIPCTVHHQTPTCVKRR
jgi:hypothetical protein